MARRFQTLPLVEGALLAAIAVVLILLGLYVPVLGLVVVFLWPVPVVLIYLRHNWRTAMLTITVAGFALAVLIGPLQAALTVVSFGSVGLAFGYGISRKLGPSVTLLLGGMSVLASLLLTVAATSAIMNVNIFATMIESMEQSANLAEDMYRRIGLGHEAEAILSTVRATLPVLILLLPGVALMAAFVNATINYQVSREVLGRLGYEVPGLPPFAEWKLPPATVFIYAGVFAFTILAHQYGLAALIDQAASNLMFLLTMAFTVHGLALLYWLLTRWQLAKWFKVGLLAFIVFSPVLVTLTHWAGIIDTVIDTRRLVEQRPPRNGGN